MRPMRISIGSKPPEGCACSRAILSCSPECSRVPDHPAWQGGAIAHPAALVTGDDFSALIHHRLNHGGHRRAIDRLHHMAVEAVRSHSLRIFLRSKTG